MWQETIHRLMVTEAIMLGHIRGPNPARQLAGKPEVIKGLMMYREKVRALVTLGLGLNPVMRTIFGPGGEGSSLLLAHPGMFVPPAPVPKVFLLLPSFSLSDKVNSLAGVSQSGQRWVNPRCDRIGRPSRGS